MYPFMASSYDKISRNILDLLFDFSNQIMLIDDSINGLLMNNEFNKNPDYLCFVKHFNLGRYFHFRCQGYMECLVITKCYSYRSIYYWLNNLVDPAVQHFMEALSCLDKVKSNPELAENNEFKKLLVQIDEFNKISMKIIEATKLYNI